MAPGRRAASAKDEEPAGPPLYFSVLYGDNQTAMFNIACQKEHLVSAIRRRCKLGRQVDIDLWATRDDQLLKLPERGDEDFLSDVIRSRDVAVLCKLEASKFPGVEPRLVPLVPDVQNYPALQQLMESIDQQVTDREAKIAQKQQSVLKKTSRLSSSLPQAGSAAADGAPGTSAGFMKGRMAIKRIMMINKMTKR